jgi:hypothetical protein
VKAREKIYSYLNYQVFVDALSLRGENGDGGEWCRPRGLDARDAESEAVPCVGVEFRQEEQTPARSRMVAWATGLGHDQTRKKRACRAQRWAGSVRRKPEPRRAVR